MQWVYLIPETDDTFNGKTEAPKTPRENEYFAFSEKKQKNKTKPKKRQTLLVPVRRAQKTKPVILAVAINHPKNTCTQSPELTRV